MATTTTTAQPATQLLTLPDHTQLPESDGTFVKNFQEHPQSILLTDAIQPLLDQRHPDSWYCIGQDSGIYWRLADPPERGAVSPDWFYVPNVPPTLGGRVRRSYVLWQEYVAPLIAIEFASDDGAEERDRTPIIGKFWAYEHAIRPAFYAIYEVSKASVEVYHLIEDRFELLPANERGHYPITPMGVELGIWRGRYRTLDLPWLRWWDAQGVLLPTSEERAAQAQEQIRQAEAQVRQAEAQARQAQERADRLAALLRSMGIEPDQ
jgi:Uma2 family endonuclease